MSHTNRYHRGGKRNYNSQYGSNNKSLKPKIGQKGREIVSNISDSNPVMQQFRAYSQAFDDKNDRFERIVKYGRDITIESKRVIFLLHTLDSEKKKANVLFDAKCKLDTICERYFQNIAHELEGRDIYQYLRAYRGGLQEFVEAFTFYWYLKNETIPHWNEIQKSLSFNIDKEGKLNDDEQMQTKSIKVVIVPSEFILGISDLTGELMRKCINSLSTGNLKMCYTTCKFVREMYKEFLGTSKPEKIMTLKDNVSKMENVCYTIQVRGSELSDMSMLASVVDKPEEFGLTEEDEGYNGY